MTALVQIDLMARGGTLALLLIWAWILIRDQWSALPVRMSVLMIATIGCHIIADIFPWPENVNAAVFILKVGQSSAPAAFWLFTKTWFNDEHSIRKRDWAWFCLSLITSGIFMILTLNITQETVLMDGLQRLIWFAFTFAALRIVWLGRTNDLVEQRRSLRTRFVVAVGVYVLLVTGAGFLANLQTEQSVMLRMINLGVPLLTGALCIATMGIRHTDLFAPQTIELPNITPSIDPGLLQISEKLCAYMDREFAWRDETLSITGLAATLGEQEYRLRRVINSQMGHRNFAAFLNNYRLAEVKNALSDPAQREVPIITIALDAGFGSLGPFNRAFREAEGMTPTEYRHKTT